MYIESTALIVEDYDDAIRFFVEALGFELIEDSPATTNDGRPKRWVVVKPPQAGLLLAQADGEQQLRGWAISTPAVSASSFASTTSKPLGGGCATTASSSSPTLATNPTDASPCLSTSLETGGTSWDPNRPRTLLGNASS